MIVVDASALVLALVDDVDVGPRCRARLRDEELAAPHLVDVEVTSTLRRLASAGIVPAARAADALEELLAIAIERFAHSPLVPRCWELRANVTSYDATYVALAEELGVPLLTADRRLADAPGPRCAIELLA